MDTTVEDAPVDLSAHRTAFVAPKSVLKENNSFSIKESAVLNPDEAKKLIRKLTIQLRNEETKLILLQKLRISQKQISLTQKPATHTNLSDHSQASKQVHSAVSTNQPHGSNKGENYLANKAVWSQLSINNHSKIIPPLPSQNYKSSNGHVKTDVTEVTKSTNRGISSNLPSSSASLVKSNQQQQQEATARQAATMQMLRKQLERALLQIPPPKPPVPDMPLIPNASSAEFVILLGLEVAVDAITKQDQKSDKNKKPESVNYCEQCSTDYTPQWQKTEIEGKITTLCERCMNSKRKRALKREHTNRLKSAFVKALQQEQEMEKALKTEIRQLSRPETSKSKSAVSNGARRSPQVIDQARQHQQQLLARSQLLSSVTNMANASPSPVQTQFQLADLERLMMFSSKSMLGGLNYPHVSSSNQQMARDLMAAASTMPQHAHRSKERVPVRAHQSHRASPYSRQN